MWIWFSSTPGPTATRSLRRSIRDRRIGWSDTWRKDGPGQSPYAHPISGLHCVIDVNSMEVLRIEDNGGVEEPNVMGEYVPKHIPERIRAASRREPLKPLHLTQPEGVSFTLDGNLLQWQNWSLRIGFNHREGMTLHTIRYRDGERSRSVAHRISLAEMIVPYRDSSEDHYRRTAFDIGEWGLGFMTTSLELGCDCLGEIQYLDAVLHNSKGEPYTITNAVCIHEEDNAVLWKHVDHDAGAEVRRMRRLTISFHVTVANYEYLVYWRLYQDGNIECEVRATGIMVTTPVAEGQPHPNGTLVDERTYAPFHQHFLVARLDMDVDGGDNTVVHVGVVRRADGPRQSVRSFGGAAERPAENGERRQTGRQLRDAEVVEGRQHQRGQRPRHESVVQVGAHRRASDDVRQELTGVPACHRDRPHAVGDTQQSRRTLACRRIRQPVLEGHRTGRMDEG